MSVYIIEFFAIVGKPPGSKKRAIYAKKVRWDSLEDVVDSAHQLGWSDIKHTPWVDPLREGTR